MVAVIYVPLVNPNEPEALLAAFHVQEGDKVEVDDLICTLETTKSTAEVFAEAAGYVLGITVRIGDTVHAGDVLGYISESPELVLPELQHENGARGKGDSIPEGIRITKPALALVEEYKLEFSLFSPGLLITEAVVRDVLIKSSFSVDSTPTGDYDPNAVVIYGAGGHGKSVLDLLESSGSYKTVGFIDDGVPSGNLVMGLRVLGDKVILSDLHKDGIRLAVNAVGGIGNVRIRQLIFRRLIEAGFGFPTVVHPTAYVEPTAKLAPGVQVFPLAYVGSEVEVGFGSIVNTGAIVSHECVLGDIVNISPGAILAGGVRVGTGALIGMGVTVNLMVKIGEGARVGNSAVVKMDVPAGGVVGAGTIWPK
jgi:acetyltransferase EpsM